MRKIKKYKLLRFGSIATVVGVLFLFTGIPWMHTFLSKSEPIPASVMVVSGWLWGFDGIMNQTVAEFKKKVYHSIILTGDSLDIAKAKESFLSKGIAAENIEMVPRIHHRGWQNTFQEAEGLRSYLEKKETRVQAVNVIAGAMHGKKTLVIFKRVLGSSCNVGIITFKTGYYNEKRVWASPSAIKWTLEYFIGYLYALVWQFPTT